MTETPNIYFTFSLNDPELEDEEKAKFAKKLLKQLRNCDEVERAERTEDLNPEEGSRPGFATLMGFLTAEVSVKNLKAFLGFLGDRIQDKSLKIKVKVGEQEIELVANSEEELKKLETTALKLMEKMKEEANG
jgi:hypothetical protein